MDCMPKVLINKHFNFPSWWELRACHNSVSHSNLPRLYNPQWSSALHQYLQPGGGQLFAGVTRQPAWRIKALFAPKRSHNTSAWGQWGLRSDPYNPMWWVVKHRRSDSKRWRKRKFKTEVLLWFKLSLIRVGLCSKSVAQNYHIIVAILIFWDPALLQQVTFKLLLSFNTKSWKSSRSFSPSCLQFPPEVNSVLHVMVFVLYPSSGLLFFLIFFFVVMWYEIIKMPLNSTFFHEKNAATSAEDSFTLYVNDKIALHSMSLTR